MTLAEAPVPTPGLRERKKAATRAQIVAVADRLFVERGFDDVTLDEVAAECVISVRTVLRYFDTKEALALSEELDYLERFQVGISKRHGGALEYWRHYIGMMSAEFATRSTGSSDWLRRHFRLVSQPPLFDGFLRIQREFQDTLATELAADFGPEYELTARLLAAALVSGNEAGVASELRDRRAFDPDELLNVIDLACEIFIPHLPQKQRAGTPAKPAKTRTAKRPVRKPAAARK
jgi:AcrR family transcriptional regulator